LNLSDASLTLILHRSAKETCIEKYLMKPTKMPKVTKVGLQEHLLELIVDCDLVCYPYNASYLPSLTLLIAISVR